MNMAQIVINYSEHPDFKAGETYSVKDFDEKIGKIDRDYQRKHDEYVKHFGDYDAWDAEVEKLNAGETEVDPKTKESLDYQFPYNKVSFSLIAPELGQGNDAVLTQRYDIGDGIGGLRTMLARSGIDQKIKNLIDAEMKQESPAPKKEQGNTQENGKKTAKEIVDQSRAEVADKIRKLLEDGRLIWREGANGGWAIPHNPYTKRNMTGANRIRLQLEQVLKGYKDPRWLTHDQAVSAGAHVKAGEHGVLLEKWSTGRYEESIDPDEPDPEKRVKREFVKYDTPHVSFYKVFNAEQIEGLSAYEPMKPLIGEKGYETLIDQVLKSAECGINEDANAKISYDRDTDVLTLPPAASFDDKSVYLEKVLHELAHSTGHATRLDRFKYTKPGTPSYAREELRAELGTVFVQAELGLGVSNSVDENHRAYVEEWIKSIENNPDELFNAGRDAERIADRLMGNFNRTHDLNSSIEQPLKGMLSHAVIDEIIRVYQEGNKAIDDAMDDHRLDLEPGDSMLKYDELVIRGDTFAKKNKDIFDDLVQAGNTLFSSEQEIAALCYALGRVLGWESVGADPEREQKKSRIEINPDIEM